MPENEEYPQEDPVAQRVQEIVDRIARLREPFRRRRRAWSDAILGSLEKRGRERQRGYYNPGEEEEVETLQEQITELKAELERLRKGPRTTVAIRPE